MTNWQPTSEELMWLAEFAGLTRGSYRGVGVNTGKAAYFLNHVFFCYIAKWQPHKDGNQLLLILEALVDYRQKSIDKLKKDIPEISGSLTNGWGRVLQDLVEEAQDEDTFTLPTAVCKAVLAIKEKG